MSDTLSARCLPLLALASLAFWPFPHVRADEFRLASGGQLRGEWLNPQRTPGSDYVIQTERGVKLRLENRQVLEVERVASHEEEYKLRLAKCGETAAEQWQLAQWCYAQGLLEQRRFHLDRTIELEPNHDRARHSLGQIYVDGEWTTPAEIKQAEGYVFYKGRWRTIQEIELFEVQAKRELAEKEWANRLRRWRQDIAAGPRSKEAWQAIEMINAPEAIRPLTQILANEPVRDVKMHFTTVLANINSADSVAALVHVSLNDADIEMFYDCLGKLLKLHPPNLSEPYIAALADANNARVNRAALALSMIKDKSAISPLISALVTKHAFVIPGTGRAPSGGYSATFSKGATDGLGTTGGGSTLVQNDDPKLGIANVRNEEVLTALTKLSGGANFGFDGKAWRYWLAQEKKRESQISASRRDDP